MEDREKIREAREWVVEREEAFHHFSQQLVAHEAGESIHCREG